MKFMFIVAFLASCLYAEDADSTDAWKKAIRRFETGSEDSISVIWRHKFISQSGTKAERHVEMKLTNENDFPVVVKYLTSHLCKAFLQKDLQAGEWDIVKIGSKGHSAKITFWWSDNYPCRRFKNDEVAKLRILLSVSKDKIAAIKAEVLERLKKLQPISDTTKAPAAPENPPEKKRKRK